MQVTPAHFYEFGGFRLDTAKRLLQRLDGTMVPLTPRVFETLLYWWNITIPSSTRNG
jgi:hypothetical protein